jgi:hypothetical protein
MDFGVLVIFSGIMIGGLTLGMLLSVVRPRDEEAAAMHRHLARRALAALPGPSRPTSAEYEPSGDLGFYDEGQGRAA